MTFWGHMWGDLPMIFTSDEVTREKSLANRITSDPKIIIHGNNVSFYFLHAIWCSEHTISLSTIVDRWFRYCR